MKKKLLIIFSLLLILPLTVKAEPNVSELDTFLEGNVILFNGTTLDSSHAVMCKLLDDQSEEIDMLSVEVNNEGTNGIFNGTFMAPATGNYTVACANYEGGTIVTDEVSVEEMTEFTVEFNTNGGSTIDSVNVTAGQAISRPEDPTKNNKVFGGWYEDDTLTTPFDFSTRITANITIYAKWNDVDIQSQTRVQVIYDGGGTYQVNFDTDDPDNQGPMNVQLTESANYFVDSGVEVTLTATPSNGQHLAGWYTTHEDEDPNDPGHMIWIEDNLLSNQTTYTFTPEGEFMNIKLVFEEDSVVIPEVYTVTFNTNGGSEIPPIDVPAGDLVDRPDQDPSNGDLIFAGWFDDDTLTTEFDFNTPITSNTTIYAKWENPDPPVEPGEDPVDDKTYNVPDSNGNFISFAEEEGHTYTFEVTDFTNLTDEQLEAMDPPMDRETYEQIKNTMIDAAKPHGTLISFLDISVYDENDSVVHNVNGEFIIKLLITEEMKKYNTFKLIYVEDDMSLGQVIDLEASGNYLVGRLPHLSTYILAGSNTDTTTNDTNSTTTNDTKAPKTYDGIMTWVITLAISMLGLTALFIAYRRKKLVIRK